jgi:hypothetical protein
MFAVIQYIDGETQNRRFLLIGPFPDRFDAEQFALQNCQRHGWDIHPLLPADVKVT